MSYIYWDEDDEVKGERLYETKEGRVKAFNHILGRYVGNTGVDTNSKEDFHMNMDSVIEIIENDKKFRDFTFDNYHVFIFYDRNQKRVRVEKITYEMLGSVAQNPDKLDNERFQDKLFSLADNLYEKVRDEDNLKRLQQHVLT